MAFIYEVISDEDRKTYQIEDRYIEWYIDRARRSFLLRRGFPASDYEIFELYLDGIFIKIQTIRSVIGSAKEGLSIHYTLTLLDINKSFMDRKEEILNMFKEGLQAYVLYRWPFPNKKLTIDISKNIYGGAK